ncbi:MAG: hypothetical protein WC515_06435 [Candidatus Omnitrophota bacterium]
MGTIEAVKKGFSVATKNLGLVLVIFAFNLIWNLASIPFAQAPGTTVTPQATASAMALSIVFILASIFVQGGSLGIVRDSIKEGSAKLGKFASYGLKYYIKLFGLGLLIILVIAVFALIATIIIAATTPINNPVVTAVAAIIAITIGAVGLYCILLLMMSPYVLVCEESGVVASMKRSMEVVRKAIGRVLLLLVVLILISLGIGFLIGFVIGITTAAMPVKVSQVVIGVINSAFNGYLGVVMMASFMTIYLALAGKEKVAAQKVF